MKGIGYVCHTPQIGRIVFDVYTKLSGGLKPIVRDSDIPRGKRPVFEAQVLVDFKKRLRASLPQYIQTSRLYHIITMIYLPMDRAVSRHRPVQ